MVKINGPYVVCQSLTSTFISVSVHFPLPTANDPLSVSSDDFTKSCKLEHAVFVSAQEALASFRSIKHSTPKAFISTGNILPFMKDGPMNFVMGALQKTTMATLMNYSNRAYAAERIRYIAFFVAMTSMNTR